MCGEIKEMHGSYNVHTTLPNKNNTIKSKYIDYTFNKI